MLRLPSTHRHWYASRNTGKWANGGPPAGGYWTSLGCRATSLMPWNTLTMLLRLTSETSLCFLRKWPSKYFGTIAYLHFLHATILFSGKCSNNVWKSSMTERCSLYGRRHLTVLIALNAAVLPLLFLVSFVVIDSPCLLSLRLISHRVGSLACVLFLLHGAWTCVAGGLSYCGERASPWDSYDPAHLSTRRSNVNTHVFRISNHNDPFTIIMAVFWYNRGSVEGTGTILFCASKYDQTRVTFVW